MKTTLRKAETDLRRLVELASQGEDVVITVDGEPAAMFVRWLAEGKEVVISVDGKPKAKVSRADATHPPKHPDMVSWLKQLEELRQRFSTGKAGSTVEQILEEDRADRF